MIQSIWTLFNAAPFRHRLRSWQPSQPPPTSSAHKHRLFWQGLAPIKPSAQRNSKATFLQNHNIMHFFCVFSLLFFFSPLAAVGSLIWKIWAVRSRKLWVLISWAKLDETFWCASNLSKDQGRANYFFIYLFFWGNTILWAVLIKHSCDSCL